MGPIITSEHCMKKMVQSSLSIDGIHGREMGLSSSGKAIGYDSIMPVYFLRNYSSRLGQFIERQRQLMCTKPSLRKKNSILVATFPERFSREDSREWMNLGRAVVCNAKGSQCFHEGPGEAIMMNNFEGANTGLPVLHSSLKVNEEHMKTVSAPPLKTESDVLLANYIPVFVMLPLDVISVDNKFRSTELFHANLRALRAAHVDGLMLDVWWGIVEGKGPKQYDWSAYRSLFQTIQEHGFKLQVVMSFHQCGGNVGDSCFIPLPNWVLEAGRENPDLFFTNKVGKRNSEYLSFGIDTEPVLNGRTGVEVYSDFARSFRENMNEFFESGLITEVEVGLGPAGELRYPSYPESHGWRFPGIGEFQCYDKYMLSKLKEAAKTAGRNEWGNSGPHNAGGYNDWPQSTGFFSNDGSFSSDYGRFFLEWYSNELVEHGNRILEAATHVFAGCDIKLAAKVAGVHWWYNSKNHAAELAAGYYNLRERDGYKPIAKMLARHNTVLNFTCIEMRDNEQYWEARCGPEGLVWQVLNAGWNEGIEVACENALPRYDRGAFDQIMKNGRPEGISRDRPPQRRISAFTFLRLNPDLMQEHNWREFTKFVRSMHADLDYHPEPEKYFRPRKPVQPSKTIKSLPDVLGMPVASVPLDSRHVPLAPMRQMDSFFTTDAPGGGLGAQLGEFKSQQSCEDLVYPICATGDEEDDDMDFKWSKFPGFLL